MIRAAKLPVSESPVGRAIAAFAALIFPNGVIKIIVGKFWPKGVDKNQFGIGKLPKKEVADSFFATCTYQNIRIGDVGGK